MTDEEASLAPGDIIRSMRAAIEALKAKLQEEMGGWLVAEFLDAAGTDGHWMHKVILAERLSDPWIDGDPVAARGNA